MKHLITFLMIFAFVGVFSQIRESSIISGTILNQKTQVPMHGVTVININKVKGTTTNAMGTFQIEAEVNDTLHLSFIGFDPLKVKVTNQWFKSRTTTIELIERAVAIDEVEVTGIVLTGFLEVDSKLIPLRSDYRYSISGLPHGYEGGKRNSGFSKVMSSIFNPADALYNIFGKKPRELARLREMKKDPTVKEVLASKFDRETLSALLGVTKKEIEDILSNCSYSETFIKTANDLQIMDAISECYEEYKLMSRK
ncbi:MAG: carboxypeptidase-like regulatory domain-containing protein [Flavobacteriaceae bacterium]